MKKLIQTFIFLFALVASPSAMAQFQFQNPTPTSVDAVILDFCHITGIDSVVIQGFGKFLCATATNRHYIRVYTTTA